MSADHNTIAWANGEEPVFRSGDHVRVSERFPIGHYRVPLYVRGKAAIVEKVIERRAVDNEAEAYGRNAGEQLHYYRVSIPMSELWPQYRGSGRDGLHIEIYESWLERDEG